ncbi:MAG: carbohydrate ABC transporter permease [Caldilineaceae bacterium]|nr:carbohydrate ABC transporter permease [Caldilineaceae bacterium]
MSVTQLPLGQPAAAQAPLVAKPRRKLKERLWLASLQILITVLSVTFLVPTLWMISSSLKVSTEVFAHPIVWIPRNPHWANYITAFTGHLPLASFIWNTIKIVVFAVLGTLLSSSLVAYSFARIDWPGKNIWFGLLLGTMMLPDIVTLVPRFILFRTIGWYDTFYPLIVPYWGAVMALYVFLIRQFFMGIPGELEDAAYIDGASRLRTLTQILMPLSKPVMATVAVFALLQHYNDFLNPLIYLKTMDKFPLAVGIKMFNDFEVQRWEIVFAVSTIMLAPILVLFIFAQRFFVQGITMTGFGGR